MGKKHRILLHTGVRSLALVVGEEEEEERRRRRRKNWSDPYTLLIAR